MAEEIFDITIPITSKIDINIFKYIIAQGIDSRLTGFTKSKFYMKKYHLQLDFHVDELEILIRRLLECPDTNDENTETWVDENAETWVDVIVLIQYGYDVV